MKNLIKNKGFIIIIVIAFLSVLLLLVWVVVDIGCGEILQTRLQNDDAAASYIARVGAEMMYARLKHKTQAQWPERISGNVVTKFSGGQTVGSIDVTANTISSTMFGIVSTGTTSGGHAARVSVKYAFLSTAGGSNPYTNGYPIGSIGSMELYGRRFLFLRSWVRADGPLASGSSITTNSYVQVRGDILQNQDIQAPSFWQGYNPDTEQWTVKATYDTNGDGNRITNINSDNIVNIADAGGDPAQEAVFTADNINGDSEINDLDAFTAYYTVELNKQNLGLAPGEQNYYGTSQTFGPGDVPQGQQIIFVNGNADILFNDQNWSGGSCDHTIVVTGNITIVQPSNGSDDRLTLIAYGDVNTGGVRAFGGVRGNLVVYANGDFNGYFGGRTNGSIMAKDNVYIDTVLPIPGLLNRDINRGTDNWADPANWPLGLPASYNTISPNFSIDETQKAVWDKS